MVAPTIAHASCPRRRRSGLLIAALTPSLAHARLWAKATLMVLLHAISGLVPRSRRRWVFGHAGDLFAGNPKYLFIWMTIHRPDIRVAWLTDDPETLRLLRDEGYRALARWSPAGLLAALRARVFVFAHGTGNVNAALSGGAFLLNLWHGVGLKAVHLGHRDGKTADAERRTQLGMLGRAAALEYLEPYDMLVTTSDMTQRHFSEQFRLPPERCPQFGYSRLDCASDAALAERADGLDRATGWRLIPEPYAEAYIYMPTFRDTERPFLDEALPDLAELSRALAARNALLYVKPHPYTRVELPPAHANIRRWPDAIDVHPYLARFAGLITDYSSILYDYLFVRSTGAILYTFDMERYLAADRSLLYPFEENVAGLRVETFAVLCDALREGTALRPEACAGVERIRDRFWGGSSAPASPAIVSHVEALLAVRGGGRGASR